MKELKEILLETRPIFKGKFLELEVDTVKLPDGRITTRDCIRHPGAVAVLPIFADGTVVMVEQYRHAAKQSFIEIPAGKIEPNQSKEETAMRELMEETGLVSNELIHVGHYHPCIGYSDEIIDFYIALNSKTGKQRLDDDEHLFIKTMSFAKVVEACENGTQTDSKTIAGIIRIRSWWKKNGPFPLDLGEL